MTDTSGVDAQGIGLHLNWLIVGQRPPRADNVSAAAASGDGGGLLGEERPGGPIRSDDVEDCEAKVGLDLHDLLDAYGYQTVQTRNGLDALTLARVHRPDLILMDIQLPEVSGLEVTRWLKEDEELRDIPVVAVTAFAMKGDEERIRQGGCEAYISKPISVPRFIETIKSYLGDA